MLADPATATAAVGVAEPVRSAAAIGARPEAPTIELVTANPTTGAPRIEVPAEAVIVPSIGLMIGEPQSTMCPSCNMPVPIDGFMVCAECSMAMHSANCCSRALYADNDMLRMCLMCVRTYH